MIWREDWEKPLVLNERRVRLLASGEGVFLYMDLDPFNLSAKVIKLFTMVTAANLGEVCLGEAYVM